VASSTTDGTPIISVRSVTKSYGKGAGKTTVLRGVSFDVARGEFLALVGQSGSGKSTLLNIIGGLDQPDSGDVTVLGLRYAAASERARAELRNRRIGFVFQAFNLLDHLSCLANVTMPANFRAGGQGPGAGPAGSVEARGLEVLRRVGMSDLARRRPSELSGGQKQRVAIARALFAEPDVLLCDEPTGNLDTETGRSVIEFFRELNQRDKVTLVVVTHERRVSSVASRIIAMRDGAIVESNDDHEAHGDPAGPTSQRAAGGGAP
jgi:putative ABC transport system ATP-binding protein